MDLVSRNHEAKNKSALGKILLGIETEKTGHAGGLSTKLLKQEQEFEQ